MVLKQLVCLLEVLGNAPPSFPPPLANKFDRVGCLIDDCALLSRKGARDYLPHNHHTYRAGILLRYFV